jgi:general stress protein 26
VRTDEQLSDSQIRGRDEANIEELTALVDDFDTAMLTTVSSDNLLHARPMAIAGRDSPLTTIFFVTDLDSPKVDEAAATSTSLLSLQNSGIFIALSGRLTVKTDIPSQLRSLWKPKWEVWFSDDAREEIALLQFRIDHAEFWNRSGANRWRILWRTQLARLRHEPLDDQSLPGHAKVEVS